jgi:hypothetical protein
MDITTITFDLTKMTYGQYKGMFDPKEEEGASDKVLARVAGMTEKQLRDLQYPDYRILLNEFFKKCREPLASPNSLSASS